MELHAAALLSALAAAVFAAATTTRPLLCALLATFASTLVALTYVPPPAPATVASGVVATAVLGFARPHWRAVGPLAAGVFGAIAAAMLVAQGLPYAPAIAAAVGIIAASAGLAKRRPDFAPATLRDEALLLIGSFGLVLAVGTELIDGWRAAVALTATPLETEHLTLHVSIVAATIGSLSLGGLYTLWKRR